MGTLDTAQMPLAQMAPHLTTFYPTRTYLRMTFYAARITATTFQHRHHLCRHPHHRHQRQRFISFIIIIFFPSRKL